MLYVIAEFCDARVQRQYFGKYNELKLARTTVYGDLIDSENTGKHLQSFYNYGSVT